LSSPSAKRRWFFRLLALLLGLSLVAGLELGLRLAGVADAPVYEPPRLVTVIREGAIQGEFEFKFGRHFEEWTDEQGQARVRTARECVLEPGAGYPGGGGMRDISFSAQPEPDARRFFVLGGSAALGQAPVARGQHDWTTTPLPSGPGALDESQAISGQLQAILQARGENAEVINAGMIAQDSGSVRLIAREVLAWQPEALLLYLGNNEGIGLAYAMKDLDLPVVSEMRGAFRNLRMYRLIADRLVPALHQTRNLASQAEGRRTDVENQVLGEVVLTQWASARRPLIDAQEQPEDAPFLALQERFRRNLTLIVQEAAQAGVGVYVIPTPPSLLTRPFFPGHHPTLSHQRLERCEQYVNVGYQALEARDWAQAAEFGAKAVELDDANAGGHYVLGAALGGLDRREEALASLERALLLDLSRKRTLPAYVPIAQQVCAELGCRTGDAHGALKALALAEGTAVYDRMLGDHEHLTPQGNAWVAGLFAELMRGE